MGDLEQRVTAIEDELDALYARHCIEQWDSEIARRRAFVLARRRQREAENESAAHTAPASRRRTGGTGPVHSVPAAQATVAVDLSRIDLDDLRILAL